MARAGWQEYINAHKSWYQRQFPKTKTASELWKRYMRRRWKALPDADRQRYTGAAQNGGLVTDQPPPHENGGRLPPLQNAQAQAGPAAAAHVPVVVLPPAAVQQPATVPPPTAPQPGPAGVEQVPVNQQPPASQRPSEPLDGSAVVEASREASGQWIPEITLPPPSGGRIRDLADIQNQTGWRKEITEEDKRWIPGTQLGHGGFGVAWLWVQLDDNNNIIDRMVAKDTNLNPESRWFYLLNWADNKQFEVPKEVEMHRLMCSGQPKPRYVVGYRGFNVNRDLRMYRIAMDVAEFGDLVNLKYHLLEAPPKGGADPRKEGWDTWLRLGLEIWLALVEACERMEQCNIVHRDVKTDNVLFAQDRNDDFNGWKFKPVLADFGIAIQTSSEKFRNPVDYDNMGTTNYFAPEMIRVIPQYLPDPMGEKTNVYCLALMMFRWFTDRSPVQKKNDFGPFRTPTVERATSLNEVTSEEEDESDTSSRPVGTDTRKCNKEKMLKLFIKDGKEDKRTEKVVDDTFKLTEVVSDDRLRSLIKRCLRFQPDERPTLEELKTAIGNELAALDSDDRPDSFIRYLDWLKEDRFAIGTAFEAEVDEDE